MKLTKEKTDTLLDVFDNYPENVKNKFSDDFRCMDGIQRQLDSLGSSSGPIFYMLWDEEKYAFTLQKMDVL